MLQQVTEISADTGSKNPLWLDEEFVLRVCQHPTVVGLRQLILVMQGPAGPVSVDIADTVGEVASKFKLAPYTAIYGSVIADPHGGSVGLAGLAAAIRPDVVSLVYNKIGEIGTTHIGLKQIGPGGMAELLAEEKPDVLVGRINKLLADHYPHHATR